MEVCIDYTRLGDTGLEVSKICLGCMSFGDNRRGFHSGWLLDEEHSRAIRDFTRREDVVIATKLFFGDSTFGTGGKPTPGSTGLSRKAIFNQVNASLKRLGTDYIDILYIHRWDYSTPIEETMCALNDLVRSG